MSVTVTQSACAFPEVKAAHRNQMLLASEVSPFPSSAVLPHDFGLWRQTMPRRCCTWPLVASRGPEHSEAGDIHTYIPSRPSYPGFPDPYGSKLPPSRILTHTDLNSTELLRPEAAGTCTVTGLGTLGRRVPTRACRRHLPLPSLGPTLPSSSPQPPRCGSPPPRSWHHGRNQTISTPKPGAPP